MPISFLETGDAVLTNPTSIQTVSGPVEELILDNSSAATTTNPTLAIGTPLGAPVNSGGIMLTGGATTASAFECHNNFATGAHLFTHTNTGFRAATCDLHTSAGTQQAPLPVPASQTLGYFIAGGYNGSAYVGGLTIQTISDQAWTPTNMPCHTDFYIGVPNDPNASDVKCLTLNGDGNGGITVWRALTVTANPAANHVGLVLSMPATPTSANTPGTTGQIIWDANNVYVCTNGGVAGSATWKAAALTAV